MGGVRGELCAYRIAELESLQGEQVGVMVDGHLHRSEGGLVVTAEPDGTGPSVRLGEIKQPPNDADYIESIIGAKVHVRGIYRPDVREIVVYDLGWVEKHDPQTN